MADDHIIVKDAELSQLASDAIPVDKLQPFALQYLQVPHTQFKNIVHDERNISHDMTMQCLSNWRARQGEHATRQNLYNVLNQARHKHGWFNIQDYSFLIYGNQPDSDMSTESK